MAAVGGRVARGAVKGRLWRWSSRVSVRDGDGCVVEKGIVDAGLVVEGGGAEGRSAHRLLVAVGVDVGVDMGGTHG